MNWYLEVLKKYAVFNGRARRKEYWYFVLFHLIIIIILGAIDNATQSFISPGMGIVFLSGIYMLAVLIPGIAVLVRRLHDTGRSSWWILIHFIPLIGAIVLLAFTIQNSEPGQNQYGVNPKEADG